MSFRLPDLRKSCHSRLAPIDQLENIKENDIYQSKIESITDYNIQRQCRQSLRIKEGANKIYNLAGNFFQKLDAAKAILVSDQKIERVTSMYDYSAKGPQKELIDTKSKGQITISEIKVPLLWRSINGQLFANGIYSLFCIIKAGSDVFETQLVCDIDNNMNDVIFRDIIQINNVDFDSKCVIELYGYAVNHSSISLVRKNSKRRSSNSEILNIDKNGKRRYPFKLLGLITLDITNSAQCESSCNLDNYTYQPDCDIPLFGTMSYTFCMIPMSKFKCIFRGQFEIEFLYDKLSDHRNWVAYHCEIKDRMIHCWKLVKHIQELVNVTRMPLSEREDVETADQIIPLIKQTNLTVIKTDDGDVQLKIGTYFDSEYQDYQEILIRSERILSLRDAVKCHIEELDIWSDSFDFEEIVVKPTSLLRHGSVFRNSLCLE